MVPKAGDHGKAKARRGVPAGWAGAGAWGCPRRVGVSGCCHGGVETPQHAGRTRAPPGLSKRREKTHHLAWSADAVPLAMRSLPGAIFLADMHSERHPFPEEKRPDVTADAFSFYFRWPQRSQFSKSLPNDSPGNWWQNSRWLQEGRGWAFNNSVAFVRAAKPPGAPATGPALVRTVQT